MQASDYLRLFLGGLASISSLTIHHWAAAFCAVSVGIIAWLNYFEGRRRRKAGPVKAAENNPKS